VAVTAFRAPPGTFDVLPPASGRYVAAVASFATHVQRAGYGLVMSPMFEDVGVFQRVGEATDIVRKEMYDFSDKGGRHVALRPEGTASVMRAFVQHRPPVPFKAWYVGPSFRYERPQAGRYRQHHQLGVEVIGSADPDVDVEVIALQNEFYASVGLRRVRLALNSLGDENCAPAYRQRLLAFLAERADQLCDEHRTRYAENPLRVLDCKSPACVAMTANAPMQIDELCDDCRKHFDRVQDGLRLVGVAFDLAPRLVRGLDYYTRTAWEFSAEALDAAQNAVGGGGRLDGLIAALGGPPTPAIGFGVGIERMLLACDGEGVFPPPSPAVEVFVVDTAGGADAVALTAELRAAGLGCDRAFDGRSLKAQLKAADRSGARWAFIVGPDELARGVVAVKPLRGEAGQEDVPREGAVEYLAGRVRAGT
jgi:histidyl-tRNA synthetase